MKKNKKICGIQYSSKINIDNKFYIKINNPLVNMQNDEADFESIIIAIKCKNPEAKFEIGFNEEIIEWNGKFNTTSKNINTYLRFLYRVSRFQKAFPEWVDVSEYNQETIKLFQKELEKAKKDSKISNNIPNSKASKWKENMPQEKDIETRLTHTKKGKEYLKKICLESKKQIELTDIIYNQLPNGLFNISNTETPSNSKRILPTGYIDIWSIDKEDDLCVFELKRDIGNQKLGLITELFFYAVYAKEFLCNENILHEKSKIKNYRGYEQLYTNVKNKKLRNVKAIFLLGSGVHTTIKALEKEIVTLLNTNKFGIEFTFVEYEIEEIKKIA